MNTDWKNIMPMHSWIAPCALMVGTLMLASGPAKAQEAADAVQPETTVTLRAAAPAEPVTAKEQMVVAANPLAAEAGLKILREGGTAADALVAVQAVLGLVEPQSSGLGGGAFLVYYDAATGKVTTIDGRETAPLAASSDLFLAPDGKPLGFFEAVVGGRAVGVPGVVRLMEKAHNAWGKRPWTSLFDDAITLADDGFAVSARLAGLIERDRERLFVQPTTRDYFFNGGEPLKAGDILFNPDYGETLQAIATSGADAFYHEGVADKIIDAVRLHRTNPGLLTIEDFNAYETKERDAVCTRYRAHDVCGMGPPSSGALTVGQTLGMVSYFDLATLGPDDPEAWRLIGDASRLAFADRGRFIADTDFIDMPKDLVDADYLKKRSSLLLRPTALPKDEIAPGKPYWKRAELRIDGIDVSLPSTSHFVIIDSDGNIASMTSSIENVFGARLMAAGFLLNNQLTDFSFRPADANGEAIANRAEPGKRPRSSMSPTIILKDGKPVYALGSPGGSRIIPYVAKTIIALIDWDMNVQEAVALPHAVNRFGTYDLEAGTAATSLAADLEVLGYETSVRDLNSGLHGIAITADGLEGGADPRREGIAVGD